MNPSPFIPRATRLRLSSPAVVGQRHSQAVAIACSLVGQGFSSEAIFAELRGKYDSTLTSKELADIIRWASGKNFQPCTPHLSQRQTFHAPPKTLPPIKAVENFLNGFRCEEADLWHLSPWRPLEDWRVDSIMFLAGCYYAGELVNIVTAYKIDPRDEKPKPTGFGRTMERDEWMRWIRDHGTPQGNAGAWVRMNPVDGKGIADGNVMAFRFALLESDKLPFDLQVALFAKLRLPTVAILTSGGRSVHSVIRVNAPDAEDYRRKVKRLCDLLKPYGIDPATKNPSRLTRLVGAQRTIGASEDGRQRLLYFNPDAELMEAIYE